MRNPITESKKTIPSYTTENIADDLTRLDDPAKIYDTGAIRILGLKKISLTIERGEPVAAMGQSGSDKLTLMNILGCLDRPTMGHYHLDDIDTTSMNQDEPSTMRNYKIGFVFQSFNLIPRTSTLRNMELPMTYTRKPKKIRRERALIFLGRAELRARCEHWSNGLSGDQRQRAAIARVLANEPPLILTDEPTGNLDMASSVEIMELFSQLHKGGAIMVVVTHEENIAVFTDRVIRFQDGQVLSDVRNSYNAGRSSEAEEVGSCY